MPGANRARHERGAVAATRVDPAQAGIGVAQAFATWLMSWVVGNLLGSAVIGAAGYSSATDAPVWVTMASALALWAPMIAALWAVSQRFGRRDLATDFGLRFERIDLVGVAIGVLAQLVLVRSVYWPLEHAWPDTFSRSRVERNARDLYDRAHGGWLVGLVVIVVVGAPLVEELVYRGLLQRAVARRVHDAVAVVAVAAFFALIHFRWVEYPGLFVFGLVLGVCVLRTGRLGMGILAHMAFNATGLLLVART
ncbi:MAG TPA: type II CAAX endopeptidase family protein [Ilumatobacteraceae bacterium]|nr:type II CAAX endopeptidase family protein [Ilumatobacteraceae bacterium]